ncbi:hypothetical protein SAMN05192565_10923 [Methylobacterium gossipiicola]|uniref:Uncharacterized protein n=1 Tax=Methylobacterium gossipiicola TaxID=582675 RepID=A0A1I2UC85_9HYPH|nr:hypothetical protein SAMN05192565_10923 [Methylobacterium gossipiicola]
MTDPRDDPEMTGNKAMSDLLCLSFRGAMGKPGIQSRRQRKVLHHLCFWIPGSATRPRDDDEIETFDSSKSHQVRLGAAGSGRSRVIALQ